MVASSGADEVEAAVWEGGQGIACEEGRLLPHFTPSLMLRRIQLLELKKTFLLCIFGDFFRSGRSQSGSVGGGVARGCRRGGEVTPLHFTPSLMLRQTQLLELKERFLLCSFGIFLWS